MKRGLPWKKRNWIGALGLACAVTVAAWACGWYGPSDSVRFNSFLQGHDFFRLPPLPSAFDEVTGKPVRWYDGLSEDPGWEEALATARKRRAAFDQEWQRAAIAEQADDWSQAKRSLLACLNTPNGASQTQRNSAIDRLDVLEAYGHGVSVRGLRAYLTARRAFDRMIELEAPPIWPPYRLDVKPTASPSPLPVVDDALATVPHEAQLKDNIAYLQAALLYHVKDYQEAAQAFRQLAARYPHSEKREAALLLAAAATMKLSQCHPLNRPPNAENGAPYVYPHKEACGDDAWRQARQILQRLLNEYPRGRFVADARGWLAYLARWGGDHAGALIEYYRQLADPRGKQEAAFSLRMIRGDETAEEMAQVEAALADEPAAALAYAYHSLYNYAYAIEPEVWSGRLAWSEEGKREIQDKRKNTRTERQRIVAFATQMLRRYPQVGVSGGFALRVAQGNLELTEYKMAWEMAVRALALGLNVEERKQAWWVKGAAEHYLNDYVAARQTLQTLLSADQGGELTEGVRRMLAIAAENAGDVETALEQYFALGYDTDVAYLIDVLLTPAQLEQYFAHHPQSEQLQTLRYALGLRYLRDGQWTLARGALKQVRSQACGSWSPWGTYRDGEQVKFEPKDVSAPDTHTVCTEWVLSDLKTIDDLERLEQQAANAAGDEAKAEALYQFASYQYEGGTMLFYNAQAWHGWRHNLLARLAERDAYLLPNEARRHWEAAQAHDALARSLKVYLEVAQRFPQTHAAREALYTAAVCHERLAQMNDYWRSIYAHNLFAGNRLVTYREVKATYPDYQLPRGTWGWQPRTRTVNDGPGWNAPPKPKPRLTFRQRVVWKLKQVWQQSTAEVFVIWEGRVQPFLWAMFYATCLVGIGYGTCIFWIAFRQTGRLSPRSALTLVDLRADPSPTPESQTPVERVINGP